MRSRHFIAPPPTLPAERDFLIDNLLVRIHFIIEMIRWTGLAPCEFEFPFPGSLHAFLIDDSCFLTDDYELLTNNQGLRIDNP